MIDLIEPTDTLLTGYYWDCVYNSGISVSKNWTRMSLLLYPTFWKGYWMALINIKQTLLI